MMAYKYDYTSSPSYDATHPITGEQGYITEFRLNWTPYHSSTSLMYPLYTQREIYIKKFYESFHYLKGKLGQINIDNAFLNGMKYLDRAKEYIKKAQSYKPIIDEYANLSKKAFGITDTLLKITYILGFAIGLVSIAGIVLHHLQLWRAVKVIIQTAWIILIILLVNLLLLTIGIFPIAIALIESCNVFKLENLVNNKDLFPESLLNKTSTCFIGNGNLDELYDITGYLTFANNASYVLSLAGYTYNEDSGELVYHSLDRYIKIVRLDNNKNR